MRCNGLHFLQQRRAVCCVGSGINIQRIAQPHNIGITAHVGQEEGLNIQIIVHRRTSIGGVAYEIQVGNIHCPGRGRDGAGMGDDAAIHVRSRTGNGNIFNIDACDIERGQR